VHLFGVLSHIRNEWLDEDCERATKEKNEAYLTFWRQNYFF